MRLGNNPGTQCLIMVEELKTLGPTLQIRLKNLEPKLERDTKSFEKVQETFPQNLESQFAEIQKMEHLGEMVLRFAMLHETVDSCSELCHHLDELISNNYLSDAGYKKWLECAGLSLQYLETLLQAEFDSQHKPYITPGIINDCRSELEQMLQEISSKFLKTSIEKVFKCSGSDKHVTAAGVPTLLSNYRKKRNNNDKMFTEICHTSCENFLQVTLDKMRKFKKKKLYWALMPPVVWDLEL